MNEELQFWDSAKTFSFTQRKMPLNVFLRPMFRISLLCLTLFLCCRNMQGSFLRIQFFNWITKNRDNYKENIKDFNLRHILKNEFLHLDPFLNIAIQFASAEGLIFVSDKKRIVLTEKGKAFCDFILKEELFVDETAFLKNLKS